MNLRHTLLASPGLTLCSVCAQIFVYLKINKINIMSSKNRVLCYVHIIGTLIADTTYY